MPVQINTASITLKLLGSEIPVVTKLDCYKVLEFGDTLFITSRFLCNGIEMVKEETLIEAEGLDDLKNKSKKLEAIMGEYELLSASAHKRTPSKLRKSLDIPLKVARFWKSKT